MGLIMSASNNVSIFLILGVWSNLNLPPRGALTSSGDNREVKHDVYSKRQKWNFCRLFSAHCTAESKYLYLLWIVRDFILFLCDLFKDYKKRIENQR